MNKGRQLIIASVILAVLVIIALQMQRDPFEKSGKQDYSDLLPARAQGSIDKIVVKNRESSLTAEKRGEAWWISEPLELAADSEGIKSAAAFLEKMSIKDIASKNKERQSEYGLKDGTERVDVKAFSKGVELLSFAAGKATPDFQGSFILLSGDPDTVYSTDEPLPFLLRKGVKDWRNKFIVDIPKDDLERIQLVNAKGALDLEKDAQSNWVKKDDPQWKIDTNRLNQLITAFSRLTWADVADEPDPAVDYGFQKPRAKLSMAAKGKEYVVTVGNELEQPKGNTWIRAEGDPKLYQVRKPLVERITRDWEYYREGEPEARPEVKPETSKESKPEPAKAESKRKEDAKAQQPGKGKQ
jgi:hypothetical protein